MDAIQIQKILDYITLQIDRVDDEIYDSDRAELSKYVTQHLYIWRDSLYDEYEVYSKLLESIYTGEVDEK